MEKQMKTRSKIALAIVVMAVMVWEGCSKNPAEPQVNMISVDDDVAASMATTVAENTGGSMDQVNDLLSLTTTAPLQKSMEADQIEDKSTVYDEATGIWTAVISRTRGQVDGAYYAMFSRTYTYQFLDKNGQPQKYYITNGDTARTINFKVLNGEGAHHTPRLSQKLLDVSANYVATGVNTPTVVINGTCKRAATDTMTTAKATRILVHSTELKLEKVTGPRGSRLDLSKKVSGTITGTYTANITFTRGEGYTEKSVNREINITLGNGKARIKVVGMNYVGDLFTGDVD
jgi:hypothetical protein